MEELYVKSYFSKAGTVSSWWEPEEGDKSHIFAREIEVLEKMLNEESTLTSLDIACGKGRVSRMLNQRGIETISLDISQEMLDIGYRRGDIIRPSLGDGEELPYEDNSFDLVTCIDALVHFPSPEKAIGEAYRVLKKNGVYLCTTSNPYDLGFIPRAVSKSMRAILGRDFRNKGDKIFRYLSHNKIERFLVEAGFDVEEKSRLGVLPPVEVRGINGRDLYLVSESFSRRYERLDRVLEKLPIINRLAILSVYKARK